MGDKGYAVVEISLIMPIIFGVLAMVVFLFLDTIGDGLVQQEGYSILYTYQDDSEQEEGLCVENDLCRYEEKGHVFVTEVDKCSKRLRRWQVYGNIVWE